MIAAKPKPLNSLNRLLAKRERLQRSVATKTVGQRGHSELRRELDEVDWAIENLIRGRYRLG